jgi:hypothetical protein
MKNLFDGLQATAHVVVTTNMGYDASWTPSIGGPTQTGRVLFNKPTQKADITDEEYSAITTKMEYLEPGFPGLAESVNNNGNEVVIIDGIAYNCYKVDQKYDGKTVIIRIEPVA